MIKYKSTRGSSQEKTSTQAIIEGIAEDKGLYMPTEIPKLSSPIEEIENQSYQQVSLDVLQSFFPDFSEEEMSLCVLGAYDDKFESETIVPITSAGGAHFLELYHGKTAAFKDMALSILPYLLTTSLRKEKEERKIAILTATSGDTGKAALEGFSNIPGTEIIVFYPVDGVSQVQEQQMVTQEGKNVHVFSIKGNFDDAQTGVKKLFNDADFAAQLEKINCKLSSANSINIGRLIPQVAYYVYGYAQLVKRGEVSLGDPINVVVPTGNFGNILAAYLAGQMGIPINKYICASNENRVLTDFINTGTYNINRDFYLTNSPSMDILISSNLERLLYLLSKGNGEEIKHLMHQLESNKTYTVGQDIREGLSSFYGGFASMEDTNKTIGQLYTDTGYLVDTHTAVAYHVYKEYLEKTKDNTPTLIASTASAYKFADSVNASIGIEKATNGFEAVDKLHEATKVSIPKGLKDLDKKPVLHNRVLEINQMDTAVKGSLTEGKI